MFTHTEPAGVGDVVREFGAPQPYSSSRYLARDVGARPRLSVGKRMDDPTPSGSSDCGQENSPGIPSWIADTRSAHSDCNHILEVFGLSSQLTRSKRHHHRRSLHLPPGAAPRMLIASHSEPSGKEEELDCGEWSIARRSRRARTSAGGWRQIDRMPDRRCRLDQPNAG